MPPKPKFFKTPEDFRAWLETNHDQRPEILVGFYKKHNTQPPSCRRTACHWFQSAERLEARKRRLAQLFAESETARRLNLISTNKPSNSDDES